MGCIAPTEWKVTHEILNFSIETIKSPAQRTGKVYSATFESVSELRNEGTMKYMDAPRTC